MIELSSNRMIVCVRLLLIFSIAIADIGCRDYSMSMRVNLLRKKLRLKIPTSYQDLTLQEMIDMKPGCPYEDSEGREIRRMERRAVRLEGYLVKVEQLADGKTYLHLVRRGDIHLEIGLSKDFEPLRDASQRVICEMTVPFQWNHKKWNLEGLAPLAGMVRDDLIDHIYPGGTSGGTRVRISGYLLDDFVHCLAVGRTRATTWEIHPVTKFEVWDEKAGKFVPFE